MMQAGQMTSHSLDTDEAATAGTVGSHQQKKMTLNTSSEVVGNTAQGSSSMFNADVHRRTVNQSGTFTAEGNNLSPAGGAVYVKVEVNNGDANPQFGTNRCNTGLIHGSSKYSQCGQFQMNTPASPHDKEELQDTTMRDITESTRTQLLLSSEPSSRTVSSPVGDQVVTAWKLKSEFLISDIRNIVADVQNKQERIQWMFDSLAGRVPALEDFEAQRQLFEVTVENGQVVRRIEETFRREQLRVTQSANYYKSNPYQESPGVIEARDRLSDILDNLRTVEQHFGLDGSAVLKRLPRRQGKKDTKKTSFLKPLPSGINKPVRKRGRRDQPTYHLPLGKRANDLKSKVQLLLKLVDAFQDFMAHKLAPPSSERRNVRELAPEPVLPEEVELAQVAAECLYESLGNVCPNPNHDSHNVCFNLGTQESITSLPNGQKKGKFELKVAFESSTTSQTWFDVASIVTAQEGEQFLKSQSDQMDMDTVIESATSEKAMDPSYPSQQQYPARVRASPSFSSLRREHRVENTAHFCLYNHRQQIKEVAAQLKHSEACEHWLHYPEAKALTQVSGDGVQIQKLCALVQEKLSRRVRVRLARIIAESVLKFNATEWLRNDLDGENVLVYNINKNYEPHLRVQITKSGPTEPLHPGGDRRMSQTFLKLADILSDIALGANGRQSNDSSERQYRKVKKGLNVAYANVVREVENMANSGRPNSKSHEAVMTEFYTKVVSSLRKLEMSFEMPSRDKA